MPDSYVIKDQFAACFLTVQVIAWVNIFTRRRYRDIVVDSFNYCVKHKELQVNGWVIMSNHVHCILHSNNGKLSDTIRDLKRYTATKILQSIQQEPESRREWILFQFNRAAQQHNCNEVYQLWTHENHAVEIDPFSENMAESKTDYIHDKPGTGRLGSLWGRLFIQQRRRLLRQEGIDYYRKMVISSHSLHKSRAQAKPCVQGRDWLKMEALLCALAT